MIKLLNVKFRWLSLTAAIYLGLFSFVILLLRPFWYDISSFLEWATGLSFPWVPAILILSLVLTILHFYRIFPLLFPALNLIVWLAMTILLFSELGNESAMILYQFIDTLPLLAIGLVLISAIWILPSYMFWRERKIRLTALASLAMLILIFSGVFSPFSFVGRPYLQAPGEDSMTIMWHTSDKALSHVEYGEDFQYKAFASKDGSRIATSSIHKVTLNDLEPGKSYRYRVVSKEVRNFFPYNVEYGREIKSEAYEFTTFDSRSESTSFLVINDLHEQNHLWKDIVENCMDGVDFVVLNGDFFNDMNHLYQIKNRFIVPVSRALQSQTPFIFTRGNHETRGRLAGSLKEYTHYPEDSYYFTMSNGPADFIFLDAGEDKEDSHIEYSGLAAFDRYRIDETYWLSDQQPRLTDNENRATLAFSHIPLNEYQDSDSLHLEYQRVWGSILERMGLDALFSGHTHRPEIVGASPEQPFPIVIGGGRFEDKSGFAIVKVNVEGTLVEVELMNEKGEVKEEVKW